MPKFEFRLRFNIVDGSFINHEADDLTLMEGDDGFRLRLKSGEKGVPIKERSRAALIGGPYVSEEQSLRAALIAKQALLIWAVSQRLGIDLGDGKIRSGFTDYGRKLLENQIGGPVRNDVHGIDIYTYQDNLSFVSVNLKASFGKSPEHFAQTVSSRFRDPIHLTAKQVVATELYCSSFFDVSLRSRLVTLMSAVEALLQPHKRSPEATELVAKLDKAVSESGIDDGKKNSMRGSLKWLLRESIRQSGKDLSKRLLPDREYFGRSACEFFLFCYDLRSQIVHDGCIHNKSIDLLNVVNPCQQYVADLLLQSFEKQISDDKPRMSSSD